MGVQVFTFLSKEWPLMAVQQRVHDKTSYIQAYAPAAGSLNLPLAASRQSQRRPALPGSGRKGKKQDKKHLLIKNKCQMLKLFRLNFIKKIPKNSIGSREKPSSL